MVLNIRYFIVVLVVVLLCGQVIIVKELRFVRIMFRISSIMLLLFVSISVFSVIRYSSI